MECQSCGVDLHPTAIVVVGVISAKTSHSRIRSRSSIRPLSGPFVFAVVVCWYVVCLFAVVCCVLPVNRCLLFVVVVVCLLIVVCSPVVNVPVVVLLF